MTAPSEDRQSLAETDPELATATRAMGWGLALSAARCLLTYVLLPALSAASGLAGWVTPAAAVLQVLGAASATWAAYRLWRFRHPLRWAYTALAVVLVLWALVTISGRG